MNDHAERIEKLEAHLAHLERQIDQLNEVIIQQSQELDRLKKQVGRVSQTLENSEVERIKSVDTKPPHYQ
ncbi:MAG: SlyX family protein [Verrucomicrobiota bacterium]